MSVKLTDEQVAEGLISAGAYDGDDGDAARYADLAHALQERLEESEQSRKTLSHQLDRRSRGRDAETQGLLAQVDVLQERLQAAEAERDEARRNREVDARYRQRVMDALGNGSDETLWRPGYLWADEAARIIREASAARQQARREAFEEAAKLTCESCAEVEPVKPRDISKIPGASVTWAHTNPEYGDHQCNAWKIRDRALAEGER